MRIKVMYGRIRIFFKEWEENFDRMIYAYRDRIVYMVNFDENYVDISAKHNVLYDLISDILFIEREVTLI